MKSWETDPLPHRGSSKIVRVTALVIVLFLAMTGLTLGAPRVLMPMPQKSYDVGFFIQEEAAVMIELLSQAGYQTVVSTVDGKAIGTTWTQLKADLKTSDVQLDDYVAILVPCMGAGDYPATADNVALLKKANAKGMIIAAQHVDEVLGPAGLMNDHRIARSPGVIVDRNIVSSYNCPFMARSTGKPADTPQLISRLVELLSKQRAK